MYFFRICIKLWSEFYRNSSPECRVAIRPSLWRRLGREEGIGEAKKEGDRGSEGVDELVTTKQG